MRARTVGLAIGIFAVLLAVAAGAGLPIARARLQAELEARCARLADGSCRVGALELARDGMVLHDVAVRFSPPGMSAHAHVVTVEWNWWALARHRAQDVRVAAGRVVFASDRSLVATLNEMSRLRGRRDAQPARGTRDGARLSLVRVEEIDLHAGEAAGMRVQLEAGALTWSGRDGTEIEWRDAAFVVDNDNSVHAGVCRVQRGADSPDLAIRCDGPRVRVDLGALDRADDAARELAASVRAFFRRSDATAGTATTTLVSHVTMLARSGEVRLARGANVIADLSPAEVSASVVGHRLESAHVRLGATTSGPDIDVAFERSGLSQWRVDVTGDQLPLTELAQWIPAVPWHGIQNGRVQLRLRAEPAGESSGALVVDGRVALESFGLFHPGLAHDPIDNLDLTIEGAARVDLVRRRLETEGIRANLNGLTVAVAGWVERPAEDQIALDASLRVPTTSCDGIRRSLPISMTGPVDELTFAGTLGADAHLALDTRTLSTTELQVDVDDQCAVVRDNMLLGIRRLREVFVQRVTEPAGLRAFVTGPGSAAWVPLAQISPYVTHAVLTREDGRFYRHHGFDVAEIRGAIIRNVGAHRFVYGASTLSMQLTKNIFLQREKTLVRKLQEVVLTWYLERSLDKDSILELYLNVVEFGPGVYGIGPAARFFFGREPADLTPLQAIYLATLLPNPVGRFANYQRGSVSGATLSVLRNVARRMASAGYLSTSEQDFAQTESIVFRPENVPVRGALTQNVDGAMTDEMAASLSPPPNAGVPAVPSAEETSSEAAGIEDSPDTP